MNPRTLVFLLLVLSALGAVSPGASGSAAAPDSADDDFERASLGADWTVHNGEVGIVKGDLVLRSKGIGILTRSAPNFGADQFSEAVLAQGRDAGSMQQVFVRRRQSDGARYGFCYNPDPGRWEIEFDGVPRERTRILASLPVKAGPGPGDTIRIEVRGNTLKGFHNGKEILSATAAAADAITQSGPPGLAFHIRDTKVYPVPMFAGWKGGNLPKAPLVQPSSLPQVEQLEFFEKKIRPVLVEHCYKCHSTEAKSAKGGLVLDSREGLVLGGASGPAVVAGDPDKSLLIKAVRYGDKELQMPPKSKLATVQVADLETWVKMGAPDPRTQIKTPAPAPPAIDFAAARRFWSFQPPRQPPLPVVKLKEWPRNAVDSFILARLEEKGLNPVVDADKRTLIRRATFDLIGLPPTPEEIETFLADDSADAYRKVVERLLASPHYGERWGRHWLDVVRYSDTAGDSADYPIPQAHRYRNYVIHAFNQDKPYDQFIQEQIAGDLMPSRNEAEKYERIIATGFIAIARRFGEEASVDHHLTIEDTLDVLGRSVLGLTFSCARCHDHKFDPIPTEDYYALYGIFQSTRYPYAGSDKVKFQKDFVPLLPPEQVVAFLGSFREKVAALDAEIEPLAAAIRAKEKEMAVVQPASVDSALAGRSIEQLRSAYGEASKRREALAKQRPLIDDAYAVSEGTPANACVHVKGNPYQLGPEVPRRFLQVLGGQELRDRQTRSGRLELAQWLTSPANPLTARVMVNRIWQYHFGKGIVQTPSYFGKQGLPPTHPELLDFLAGHFAQNGWSVKAMHRLIMLSRTYQLASVAGAENVRIDPTNELLWKFPRRRLEAEAIRDSLLMVSNALDRTMPGPHPIPAQSSWNFSKASPFRQVYPTNGRSVYLIQQRLQKHPYLALFDGPDANASTASRLMSTTSIQALFMMNDPFVHELAAKFADRLCQAEREDTRRIERAHRLAFGRPPTPEESRLGESYLRQVHKELDLPPDKQERAAWASYVRVLLSSNEFIFVD
jgi:hypothetical protein